MGRGPSYPYVDLEQAITLARKVYDYTKRAPTQVDSVVKDAWTYSAASSSGQKVLAAEKAFGLIEDAPGTSGKSIRLTPRAIRILLDDIDSQERQTEIRKAALAPKWYEFCWKTWGSEMPASMRSNLLIEHGFVDSTVDGFLKDYKKTIAFAKLASADQQIEQKNDAPKFVVGQYVQWESQGTLRMPMAKKLVGFSPTNDYAFVEGSSTGIPVEELIEADVPEETGDQKPLSPAVHVRPMGAKVSVTSGLLQEVFSLPDGTSVSIHWPQSFTGDAFEDFSDWLDLVKKKVKRTIKTGSSDLSGEGDGAS